MIPDCCYVQWRSFARSRLVLHEGEGLAPAERLLDLIWQHQRLRRETLTTVDGRPIRILHPGFRNRGAGPDFRGAVIQFESEPVRRGDVELDRSPEHWHAHGHDSNAAYRGVVLHVVWSSPPGRSAKVPTLALRPWLDTPLEQLASGLVGDLFPTEWLLGRCHAALGRLEETSWHSLLRQAAQVRLEAKAAALGARAHDVGWEQCLREGLMSGLGYQHNVWPMRGLAERLPRCLDSLESGESRVAHLQTRLLGLSGLLPTELPAANATAQTYARRLWDRWWRERDAFADAMLPRELWRLNGVRPANHPQRRLALAAHWFALPDLCPRLEAWFVKENADANANAALLEALRVDDDPFWNWHWHLLGPPLSRPQPLLGAARVTDLAMNSILPWFWQRAKTSPNEELRLRAQALYFGWPAGQDNATLRLTLSRLHGGQRSRRPGTAAEQQALLQIASDFCRHADARCEPCPFPRHVEAWLERRATDGAAGPPGLQTSSQPLR